MGKPKDPWNYIEKDSVIRKETLKRNPQYRQEFVAAFQSYRESLPANQAANSDQELSGSFQLSPEAQNLRQRWGLTPGLVLHPDDELWNVRPDSAPAFFQGHGLAVRVIPHDNTRLIPVPPEQLSPGWIAFAGDFFDLVARLDISPHLKDGRYLTLEIDLTCSLGQIMAEVQKGVKRYQDDVLNTDRLRGQSRDIYLDIPGVQVSIFQVWDLRQQGKSAWKIVTELCPHIKGPSPDYVEGDEKTIKKAHALLAKVERAINKADQLIRSTNPAE